MTSKDCDSSTSLPIQIPSPPVSTSNPVQSDYPLPRQASTARLASPVPSRNIFGTSQIRNASHNVSGLLALGDVASQANISPYSSLPGPGISALASTFSKIPGQEHSPIETSSLRAISPAQANAQLMGLGTQTNYGSFECARSIQGAPGLTGTGLFEDPEIVKRHLVQTSEIFQSNSSNNDGQKQTTSTSDTSVKGDLSHSNDDTTQPGEDDTFSSLQLQGGDITRPIYRWTEEAEARAQGLGRQGRSNSFHLSRPQPENGTLDIGSIKVPGGFRRNFIQRSALSPTSGADSERGNRNSNRILTNSFIEFLTIYGHFAGEELDEEDEVDKSGRFFSSQSYADQDDEDADENDELMEGRALIGSNRKRKERISQGRNSLTGATLLLLKSFIGTGVLFLPKAYLNGGMMFSNIVLITVAVLSYYCFMLLIKTRLKVEGSYGDMGGILYGSWFRSTILTSIVAGQIGFVAAYIVFTSENLQAFILAVSGGTHFIETSWLILIQCAIFLPFSLLRDISKLGFTALIADALILLGLVGLYYFDFKTIIHQGGAADINNFNPNDWTLFIGTAVFTFEGIGLIIPIQESMKNTQKFPAVLAGVLIIITAIFLSVGAISYAAFGSKTQTVVLLNLPPDSKLVNVIQLLYSIAILLSTPLQIFPAIRIMENEIFTRSGRYNLYIKWQKNIFRFLVVMICAGISWFGAANLDKFVAIVGSIACVPLVYIYPPMLHLKSVAQSRFHIFTDSLLCVCGFIVMIYTTALTLMS
ncbi:Vacuolar amino acid transporter 3 [Golovinomyces cichoracearum]|uniref:Vacuolar amino acid transporter 3 n=1 Tax=Golovinomyces cichoracearum TaxID=62708 RepID=A0A420IM62_9PEZI|nr:Vacuolar amino acid transporter 3 [Golovinomyces cichoracearum]